MSERLPPAAANKAPQRITNSCRSLSYIFFRAAGFIARPKTRFHNGECQCPLIHYRRPGAACFVSWYGAGKSVYLTRIALSVTTCAVLVRSAARSTVCLEAHPNRISEQPRARIP